MPQYLVSIYHPDNYVPSLEDEAMIRQHDSLIIPMLGFAAWIGGFCVMFAYFG